MHEIILLAATQKETDWLPILLPLGVGIAAGGLSFLMFVLGVKRKGDQMDTKLWWKAGTISLWGLIIGVVVMRLTINANPKLYRSSPSVSYEYVQPKQESFAEQQKRFGEMLLRQEEDRRRAMEPTPAQLEEARRLEAQRREENERISRENREKFEQASKENRQAHEQRVAKMKQDWDARQAEREQDRIRRAQEAKAQQELEDQRTSERRQADAARLSQRRAEQDAAQAKEAAEQEKDKQYLRTLTLEQLKELREERRQAVDRAKNALREGATDTEERAAISQEFSRAVKASMSLSSVIAEKTRAKSGR